MSNPSDPNESPQNPADPQNPYGEPNYSQPSYGQPTYGQPTSAEPPAGPPQQPTYGQPEPPTAAPTPPPPYGQAAPPPYGQAPIDPTQPSPYGPPAQSPYGQQPYGQPYGQPGYPGGPAGFEQPAGKGLAITSLITGILGCSGILAIVSIVLGIIVLVRGKDGRNHGKGLAIAGIVLSVLWLIGLAAVIVVGVVASSTYSSVDDLSEGTCISASGLSNAGDTVSQIKSVSCSDSHDGEVLATHTLTSSEASSYGDDTAAQVCQSAVNQAGKIGDVTGSIHVIGLSTSITPNAGDKVACVAFDSRGTKLSGTLG